MKSTRCENCGHESSDLELTSRFVRPGTAVRGWFCRRGTGCRPQIEHRDLHISWVLYLWCNFSKICQYCYMHGLGEAFPGNRDRYVPGEAWVKWLKQLAADRTIRLNLTGGEPTLHPDFRQIMESLDETGRFSFHVCSNLTTDLSWLVELPSLELLWCSLHNIQSATWVAEFSRRLRHYRSLNPGLWLCVNLVTQNGWEEVARRFQEDMQTENIEFRISEYDSSFREAAHTPLTPLGRALACSAGRDLLCAWPDGTIFRCFAHAFAGVQPLGRIQDGWNPLENDLPCEFVRCTSCDRGYLSVCNIETNNTSS